MNEDQLIETWESNRFELAHALNLAGGDSEIILSQTCWSEVMKTLAKNKIRIETRYNGGQDD